MNLLGKIFVMLILVMSVAFMAFAVAVYSTQKNWKDEVGKLRTQLTDANKNRDAVTKERDDVTILLQNQRDRMDQDIAKLEQRKVELEKTNTDLGAGIAKLREENGIAVNAVATQSASLDAAQKERNMLREELKTTLDQRDNYFKQLVQSTDELHGARGDYNRLRETNAKLTEQISSMKLVLDGLQVNWEQIAQGQDPPPRLEGKVLAVNRDKKLVELSVGSDDGLHNGHELEVFRASKYVGRVKVVKTTADRSVGQILDEFLKAPMQEEDRITPKFADRAQQAKN